VTPTPLLSSAPKLLKNFALCSLVSLAPQHFQPMTNFSSLQNDESTRESHSPPILTAVTMREFVVIIMMMMMSGEARVVLAGSPSF